MRIPCRISGLVRLSILAVSLTFAGPALAQEWPSKPVSLVVPFPTGGTTDLLGGQVVMSFDTLTPVLPHIQAGKLTALAVTTAKRASALPDTPTLEEAGLKDFDIGTWFGVLAPAGTPEAIVERLNKEINNILAQSEFQNRMRQQGAEPMMGSPADFAKRIDEETKKFAALVKEANVKIE